MNPSPRFVRYTWHFRILAAVVLLGFFGAFQMNALGWGRMMNLVTIFLVAGGATIVYCDIALLVLRLKFVHRAWRFVGEDAISPGAAVFCFFVPVLNWFWYFTCYGKIARALFENEEEKKAAVKKAKRCAWFSFLFILVNIISVSTWELFRSMEGEHGAILAVNTILFFAKIVTEYFFVRMVDEGLQRKLQRQ